MAENSMKSLAKPKQRKNTERRNREIFAILNKDMRRILFIIINGSLNINF